MSTNLIINEQTNIRNDNCFYSNQDKNNNRLFTYNFTPFVSGDQQDTRKSYINSTNIRGILQDTNFDLNGDKINESTKLRNGVIQNTGSRRELDTRLFPGSPFMSSGQSILKNTDLSSKLLFGEDTRTSKSANVLSSYSADNFVPLIPAIKENVQNIDHIIPTYWVRGGMSSRSVIRNIDYLKSCGFKK
jgi:hypothetical protein